MEFLIKRAQKGDKDAFIEAINLCVPQLYKMGKSFISNDNDIGDILSETILISFEKLNTLRETKYFKTWLIRIYLNNINKHLKTNIKVINIDDLNHLSYKDKSIENFELKEAIKTLKEDYKVVITLFYIMDFSIKEISKILNEKEGTIKSKLSRARSSLREYYGLNKGVNNG